MVSLSEVRQTPHRCVPKVRTGLPYANVLWCLVHCTIALSVLPWGTEEIKVQILSLTLSFVTVVFGRLHGPSPKWKMRHCAVLKTSVTVNVYLMQVAIKARWRWTIHGRPRAHMWDFPTHFMWWQSWVFVLLLSCKAETNLMFISNKFLLLAFVHLFSCSQGALLPVQPLQRYPLILILMVLCGLKASELWTKDPETGQHGTPCQGPMLYYANQHNRRLTWFPAGQR